MASAETPYSNPSVNPGPSAITFEAQRLPSPEAQQEEYFDLLRRIPQSLFSEQLSHGPILNDLPDRMIAAILQLPHEIIHHILYWLDPKDILSLRATSRALHNLIHHSERDICLSLADRVQRDYDFSLPTSGGARNLLHFFEVHFSINAVCKVADLIAQRISRSLKHKNFLEDQHALSLWRRRKYLQLQSHLRRTFHILQLYLDFISRTVIEEDQHFKYFSDEEFANLHNIYDLDQQDFFARDLAWLTEEDFVSTSCSLKIFKTVCKARKVPFGLASRAYPFASVRQVLFYRGLMPFEKLLDENSNTVEQEMILRNLTSDLAMRGKTVTNPRTHTLPPLTSIHHVGLLDHGRQPSQNLVHRSVGTRNEFFSNQDLWDKSGRAYMMRKLGKFPHLQSVTSWLVIMLSDLEDNKGDVTIGPWDQPT